MRGEKIPDGVGVLRCDLCPAAERVGGGFDVIFIRNAVFIACEVKGHRDAEQHQNARDDCRALGPRAEDAKALADQHFGDVIARESRGQHAGDRAGQRIVSAHLILAKEEVVEHLADRDGCAERHTVFKNRHRPWERDRRAGQLALARAVEKHRDDRDGEARERVGDEQRERVGIEIGVRDQSLARLVDIAVVAVDVYPAVHPDERGEEAEMRRAARGITVEKIARKAHDERFHPRGKEVADDIECGRGQHLARHHHAQHRERIVEDRFKHRRKRRTADHAPEVKVERRCDRRGEQKGEQDRHNLAEKAGEVDGGKQSFAPHGQGMVAVCRAALCQVRKREHREQQSEAERDVDAVMRAGGKQKIDCVLRGVEPLSGRHLRQQCDGYDEKPHSRVREPQRPRAQQLIAE